MEGLFMEHGNAFENIRYVATNNRNVSSLDAKVWLK